MNDETKQMELWTVADCAAFLRMTPVAVYSLTRNRGLVRAVPLPVVKLHGKALRFIRADVEKWVSQIAQQGRAA